jgi:hypothetical protein
MTLSASSADDSGCYDTVYIYIYIYCIYIYIYYNIYIYIYMYIPYIVPNTPYTHSLYQILATYLTDHYIVQVGKSKDHLFSLEWLSTLCVPSCDFVRHISRKKRSSVKMLNFSFFV